MDSPAPLPAASLGVTPLARPPFDPLVALLAPSVTASLTMAPS
ncbi:MAG TPA: hypothetical protein VIL48_16130 [Acidimicrobiales bacterium]